MTSDHTERELPSGTRTHPASRTPIIPGFYPDPSICRVGDIYYLANSSFEYAPGVPIHRSDDLLRWEPVGHALHSEEHFAPGHARDNGGIYAPTLRHDGARFWLITTDVSDPRRGQLLTSAESIEGPWTRPIVLEGLPGIDPDIAWDGDRCYVTYCSADPQLRGIAQVRVDPENGRVLEAPRPLWNGTGGAFPEGPHLYRRGGWWYLMIAEGGTERGHAVTIARGTGPEGPFEPCPHNPLLTHRGLEHAVQNTGHADLVENADGSWAMVYLGVRPRGYTPGFHTNGRETFLAGVEWHDDWPHVIERAYRVPERDLSFRDDFSRGIGGGWASPGEHGFASANVLDDGGLELVAPEGATRNDGLFVRAVDLLWAFEADFDVSRGTGSVALRLDSRHWYEVEVSSERATARSCVGTVDAVVGELVLADCERVTARIAALPATMGGPDDIELSVSSGDGETRVIAVLDGRYLSTEVVGGFTGRFIGIRAVEGSVRISEVRRIACAEKTE